MKRISKEETDQRRGNGANDLLITFGQCWKRRTSARPLKEASEELRQASTKDISERFRPDLGV